MATPHSHNSSEGFDAVYHFGLASVVLVARLAMAAQKRRGRSTVYGAMRLDI